MSLKIIEIARKNYDEIKIIMEIEDPVKRELQLKKTIKKLFKKSDGTPENVGISLPVFIKKMSGIIKKIQKEQKLNENKSKIEKDNKKLKTPKIENKKLKSAKKNDKGLKMTEKENETNLAEKEIMKIKLNEKKTKNSSLTAKENKNTDVEEKTHGKKRKKAKICQEKCEESIEDNDNKTKKAKKSNEKSCSLEESNKITDPRLLRYITGEANEKFFEENSLTAEKLENIVDAAKKLLDSESTKRLFSDKEDIFMQITTFKVPKTPTRQLRFILPRMLYREGDNILLFVKDIIKGKKNMDKSEEFHKELLKKHNINIISDVMCLTRLKNEYDQYELKRKLCNSYEVFLADGRISGHLAHFLGKTFTRSRKLPTPVKMDAEDLTEDIMKGLRRTNMNLHSTGNNYTICIGKTHMKNQEVAENIMAVCTQLAKLFPGGWENIRSINIKTPLSLALPIYLPLERISNIKVPVVVPKRPKNYVDVEGELTTLNYHQNVLVNPEGKVTILENKKRKLEETKENLESDKEEEMVEEEEEEKEEESDDSDEE